MSEAELVRYRWGKGALQHEVVGRIVRMRPAHLVNREGIAIEDAVEILLHLEDGRNIWTHAMAPVAALSEGD